LGWENNKEKRRKRRGRRRRRRKKKEKGEEEELRSNKLRAKKFPEGRAQLVLAL
jgi:hypothetical protein